MNTARETALEQIEKTVDLFGLIPTLEMVAEICRLKAVHLRDNWQDERSAKAWVKDATKVEACARRIV